MLSRSELKPFQTHRDYPSVSILARTHWTAPLNKQDSGGEVFFYDSGALDVHQRIAAVLRR